MRSRSASTTPAPGVAPELCEQIFHDGFTTKSARGKMRRGLGLALVHRLVTRAGGKITVTPGAGGRFDVRIPASASPQSARDGSDGESADRTAAHAAAGEPSR